MLRSRCRKFWKGRSRIFHFRLRNPAIKSPAKIKEPDSEHETFSVLPYKAWLTNSCELVMEG